MSDSKTATTDAQYEVGTVAVATVRGDRGVRIVRFRSNVNNNTMSWMTAERGLGLGDNEVADIRPLVVLDPEDPETRNAFQYLFRLLRGHIGDLLAQMPPPPRIPEPGLWGVVAATTPEGVRDEFVRRPGKCANQWQDDDGGAFLWDELRDPTLIREGLS